VGGSAGVTGGPGIGLDGSLGGTGGAAGTGSVDPDASCANDIQQGGIVQVNMLVMFDRSGSMDDEIDTNLTRWQAASAALTAFFQDSASAGMDVALRFFPHDSPAAGCNDDDCDENACAQELVPIGPLTADPAPTDAQEQALVDAVNASAPGGGQGGGTPTYAALSGAEQWAMAHQAANPNERTVVVFVTDGQPNGCNEDTNAIAGLADAARTSSGVLTYAIGISAGVDDGIMDPIAQAGGTNQAIMIEDGSAQSSLLTALQNIRGQVLSCNFVMPSQRDPSQPINPNLVNVNYTPGGGGPAGIVGGVNSAADCTSAGGWYYDNPAAPTQIILCPATCSTVQSDPSPQIQIVIGCQKVTPTPQ
jgi:Mg-chelatase subunit ChlD